MVSSLGIVSTTTIPNTGESGEERAGKGEEGVDSPLGRQVRTSYGPTGHYPPPLGKFYSRVCASAVSLIALLEAGTILLVVGVDHTPAMNPFLPNLDLPNRIAPRQASTCPRRRNPPRPSGCSSVLLS